MKTVVNTKRKWPLYLYRIVVGVTIMMILILIIGTVYGLVRSRDSVPLFRIGGSSAVIDKAGETGKSSDIAVNVFTGIGRLRIPLHSSGSGSTLILSIAFPYPDDQPFTEELAAKIGDFRSIAADYFSSLPADKLINLDETAAKKELLKRYNASLHLGKIDVLYFNDLLMIE
jgi:hypothetical protein